MTVAIRVENLGKRYRLGQTHPGSVREVLSRTVGRIRGQSRPARSSGPHIGPDGRAVDEEGRFWAVRDVSFDVKPGEVVGVIGRNGSGKSTLLKLLSQITAPTHGRLEIVGRVASLLEVGTGFHPELSGRENVYLNGAILGMTRVEVRRKFDEIVAFAEVDQFIDTPVKRYSSGMYVRLAFAVAAHLDPEILVIDEVLAVGDATFQKKCLGKLGDVARLGRTILFVSHNMAAVTRLCDRTILLSTGRLEADGPSHKVVGTYLSSGRGTTASREWPHEAAPGNEVVRLRGVRVRTENGQVTDAVDIRRRVGLEMEYDVLKPGHVLTPNYHLYNEDGVCVFITNDQSTEWRRRPRPTGRYVSTVWIPGNYLAEGTLIVGAVVSTLDPVIIHVWERDAVAFQVVDSLDGDSTRGDYAGPYPGVVRPLLPWETQYHPGRGEPQPVTEVGGAV